jgi:beta-phosphoglucomutase-like phosphatase (HAD superfamily)
MALAVILDMDGLMLDTEPIALRAWKQASCDLGHELDDLEDSEPGIRAAVAAGMRSILIPDCREPSPETRRAAHVVVVSLFIARIVIEQMINDAT